MKGYIIDGDFLISVKYLMEIEGLPTPHRKSYLKLDGEILPVISRSVPV
jgi:hypothetical protein